MDPEQTAFCYADDPIEPSAENPTVATITNSSDISQATAFNMSYYIAELASTKHDCQTIACLAGHALALFRPEQLDHNLEEDDIHDAARQILDLDRATARELFRPLLRDDNVSAQQAATTVRHLAETGTVRWDLVASLETFGRR